VRVLYFSRDYTVHDRRFLAALADTANTVGYLRLEDATPAQEPRPLPPGILPLAWAGGDTPFTPAARPRLLRSLRRVLREFQPDLVQAGPIQTVALLVAQAGFQPLVATSWGYDLLIDADKNAWHRWATHFTLQRSAAFVGDCQTIRQRAEQFGMPADRIVTFPWGVDLEHFQPGGTGSLRAQLGWGPDEFVVLSTRGWSPLYGIEELARGFTLAAQQRPELRLLMLGSGPQAGLVREIFQQGGVLDRVHFPGQVTQERLPDYYRAADLYLSASHSDGSSISLLEALACGCPALVSDIPGNREWITPGEQGRWFRCGDPVDLARQLIHLAENRHLLPEMGGTARQTAEARADWQKNFPHLLTAYQMAVNLT
jgi:glycosyltransferase involved in cell wall biosynthesis